MRAYQFIAEINSGRRRYLDAILGGSIIAGAGGLSDWLYGNKKSDNPKKNERNITQEPEISKPPELVKPLEPAPEPPVEPQQKKKAELTPSQRVDLIVKIARDRGIRGDELAQLLGQCAVESWDFRALESWETEQKLKTAAPYKKVGNVTSDDNWTYRARGFIHLFGRENYERMGKKLGIPLVENPDLAADDGYAAEIAVEFWLDRVRPWVLRNASKKIDKATRKPATAETPQERIVRIPDWSNTRVATYRINPKLELLREREAKYQEWRDKLGGKI